MTTDKLMENKKAYLLLECGRIAEVLLLGYEFTKNLNDAMSVSIYFRIHEDNIGIMTINFNRTGTTSSVSTTIDDVIVNDNLFMSLEQIDEMLLKSNGDTTISSRDAWIDLFNLKFRYGIDDKHLHVVWNGAIINASIKSIEVDVIDASIDYRMRVNNSGYTIEVPEDMVYDSRAKAQISYFGAKRWRDGIVEVSDDILDGPTMFGYSES